MSWVRGNIQNFNLGLKLLAIHQYSVEIFSYSGPSGILGSGRKQNTDKPLKRQSQQCSVSLPAEMF